LLIQPNYSYQEKGGRAFSLPLGSIYVGTYLEKDGHKIKIFDRNVNKDDNELFHVVKKFDPDLVGISTMTGRIILDAIEVASIVRELRDSMIVWGGTHPTLRPENTLESPLVDHIIRGEGELPMLDIANAIEGDKDVSSIKNVDLNPMRPFVDLNDCPIPNYDLVDMRNYKHAVQVTTSRGCPYQCTYCYNGGFWGKQGMQRWRALTADNAIELITRINEKYGEKHFAIVDDTFPLNKTRAIEICMGIKHLDLQWFAFCRADYVTNELMKAFKMGGCNILQFGFETGSQRMLDFLKKGIRIQQMKDAVKKCKKFKILCETSFMIGLPTETFHDLLLTYKFINEISADNAEFKIFQPCPGTEAYDYCISHNLFTEPKNLEEWGQTSSWGDTIINVSEIPDETLIRMKNHLNKTIIIKNKIRKFSRMLFSGYIPPPLKIMRDLKYSFNLLRG